MKRTENICFPRTGHRLLQNLLRLYFGDEIKTCTVYINDGKSLDIDPTMNYQKNHDMNLTTPIMTDRQYLVQIRYPLESLISYYKLECEGFGLGDSLESWKRFASDKIVYWIRFYEKWVTSSIPNRLVVNYGSLLDNPEDELIRSCRFLCDDDHVVDLEKVREIAESYGVERKNNMKDFKYYDQYFFDYLRDRIKGIECVDIENDILAI